MTLYPSTSRRISLAVTGRRSAIRYEISESWRISFSVSFAIPWQLYPRGTERPPGYRSRDAICGFLRRLRRLRRLRTTREVSTAAERPVVGRPLFAGRELLLDPIEAAQASAQVVDHVHQGRLTRARDHRASVLQRAVVAEDDVEHRLSQLGGKALEALDRAAHEVIADGNLAVEAPVIGHRDGPILYLVGLELADVVQQRSCHGDIAIDPRERGGDGAHGLGHGQTVFEQAVPVGLVVALGRRRIPVVGPGG